MKIKLTYRKAANPIFLESNKQTIEEIASDCAKQLSRKYRDYKPDITAQSLKRYEIGQKYMMMLKLEEYGRRLK